MMRPVGEVKVCLHREPIDMRKGRNGLAALVREGMSQDPFAPEAQYVFVGGRYDEKAYNSWAFLSELGAAANYQTWLNSAQLAWRSSPGRTKVNAASGVRTGTRHHSEPESVIRPSNRMVPQRGLLRAARLALRVALRAIAIAASRRCRRTGLSFCQGFEQEPVIIPSQRASFGRQI
jgi:hypothetical protein